MRARRCRAGRPPGDLAGLPPPDRGAPPEREVSPKATIDPDPSEWEKSAPGTGSIGGPMPTATYTARPTTAMPPKVGAPSGSVGRVGPGAAARARSEPAGATP